MNIRGILTIIVIALVIFLAVLLMNRKGSGESEFTQSLRQAADNIDEGAQDVKRSVQDALD